MEIKKTLLFLLIFQILWIGIAFSFKSPKVENCLKCHPKMFKKIKKEGKFLHAPVAKKKCLDCHRPHGFIRGAFLWRNLPYLCIKCHKDVIRQEELEFVHLPFKEGNCTACHGIHAANYNHLLKNKINVLCIECHKNIIKGKVIHPALKQGCLKCHEAHASRNKFLLKSEGDKLCLKCHNKKDIGKFHKGYPFSFECLTCHDPHSALDKRLLIKYIHKPVSGGECFECHKKDTQWSLKKKENQLCISCHKIKEGKLMHPPYKNKECSECHVPHGSKYKFLLKEPTNKICLKCHSYRNAVKGKIRYVHPLVKTGKCIECHSYHVSNYESFLKYPKRKVCIRCHKNLNKKSVKHPPCEKGECLKCHYPHSSYYIYMLKAKEKDLCFECHKDVKKQTQYFSQHTPFATQSCSVCHNPHSGVKGLLKKPWLQLCKDCHTNIFQEQHTLKYVHKIFAENNCTICHLPHASYYPFHCPKPIKRMCLECHKDIAKGIANSTYVHYPVKKGNCITCHEAHGSNNPARLKENLKDLCLECHKQELGKIKIWHKPTKNCLTCHTKHFNEFKYLLKRPVEDVCIKCHKINDRKFLKVHRGVRLSGKSCVECHNPHGGSDPKFLWNTSFHSYFIKNKCYKCHLNNGKTKRCIDCHSLSKFKGKIFHPPFKQCKCTLCHQIHVSRYEKILKKPVPILCYNCHKNIIKGIKSAERVHFPVEKGKCLLCHSPHKGKNYLLKEDLKNICIKCHKIKLKYKYYHKPFNISNCTACHVPHFSSESNLLKGKGTCLACHKLSKLKKTHKYLKSGKWCLTCHEGHGANNKVLLKKYAHKPYKSGNCKACHGTKRMGSEMCFECHKKIVKEFEKVYNHYLPSKDTPFCLYCHSPHFSDRKDFLESIDPKSVCLKCHPEVSYQKEESLYVHKHWSNCLTCHKPHGSNIPAVLKEEPNKLCGECHKSDEIFTHPIGPKAKNPYTGQPMSCITCHDPMGTNYKYLLIKSGDKALCVECHRGY